jgi:hypothetical protein
MFFGYNVFFFVFAIYLFFLFSLQKKKSKWREQSKGYKGNNHFLFPVFLLLVKTLPWTTEIGTNKKKQHQRRELLAFFAGNTKTFVSWKETSKKVMSSCLPCRQKQRTASQHPSTA